MPSDEDLEAHVKRRHARSSFACKLCSGDPKLFTDQKQLEAHITHAHKADPRAELWKEHVSIPKDLRSIGCKLCKETFHEVEVSKFKYHWKYKHPTVDYHAGHMDFKCRVCVVPEDLEDEEELVEHIEDEHGSGEKKNKKETKVRNSSN